MLAKAGIQIRPNGLCFRTLDQRYSLSKCHSTTTSLIGDLCNSYSYDLRQMKLCMTTQPQTERVLRIFVRDAVSRLSGVLKDLTPEWEDDVRWERGTDGHFRERKKRMRKLWPILNEEWLSSLSNYQTCVKQLKSDLVVGPHLDRLVGTHMSASRLEANDILTSLMYAMLDDEGRVFFTDEKFDSVWREVLGLFGANQISIKMVSPLPHLVIPAFPLRLNKELVLDRLTNEEVNRCYKAGVICSNSPRSPFIYDMVAVGIRRTKFLPKLILRGDEPHELPEAGDDGSFGSRPPPFETILSLMMYFWHCGSLNTPRFAPQVSRFGPIPFG